MSTATGVNVLRWSALGLGVFYGIYHQRQITKRERKEDRAREWKRKEDLILQAKAAYTKKTMPAASKAAEGGVVTDPDNPNFDLEAFLTMKAAEK